MKGFSPFPQSDPEARENWRVTGELMDELYFEGFWEPNEGFADAGLTRAVAFPNAVYIEFPDAGTPVWWLTLKRRSRWRAAGLYIKIWYTSAVGSTNNFTLDFGVREFDAPDVPNFRLTYAPSLTLPGPAVANTVMTAERVSTTSTIISGQKDLLVFIMNRNPADANTNALRLYGLFYRVLPQ